MMPKLTFVLALALLAIAPAALALPGLDLSLGPYLGMYSPSLETLNDQVLLWDHRPALGSAVEYGLQAKVGFPMGVGAGLNFGRWSKGDEWSEPAGPGDIYTDATKYRVTLLPLEAFADYSIPLVPALLKGRAGASLGLVWGTLKGDFTTTVNATGAELGHYSATAKGRTQTMGLRAGLDLVTIPKITIGFDVGYKFGKIEQLKVKESSVSSDIGTIYLYPDHTTGQPLPLPIELGGFSVRLVGRYHF